MHSSPPAHAPTYRPSIGPRSPITLPRAAATAPTPPAELRIIEPILVDTDGLAQLLNVSPKTAGRLIQSGAIPSFPIGRLRRVRVAAVKEFVERAEREAASKNDQTTAADGKASP
jgi:excisionase family DNA binding protein